MALTSAFDVYRPRSEWTRLLAETVDRWNKPIHAHQLLHVCVKGTGADIGIGNVTRVLETLQARGYLERPDPERNTWIKVRPLDEGSTS